MEHNLELISIIKYNHFAVNKNLENIDQQYSLREPESGGNSINWVLGHIVLNRDGVLKLLGCKKMCDKKMEKIYMKTSHIRENKESIRISRILKMFNDSQEEITKSLSELDPEENKDTVLNIAGYAFHESYHAGQLGILRRIIGKRGKLKFE